MALASTQREIIIERHTNIGDITTRQMSVWEKFVLQNAHPIRLIFNGLAVMWSVFYAFQHNLVMAVVMGLVFLFLGTAIVRTGNLGRFANTVRGQFLMTMNNPVGLVLDVLGFGLLFYGVWHHSVALTLCAVSTVALSRAWSVYKFLGR